MTPISSIPRSTIISGLAWCSERMPYPVKEIKGDTFPMTWADDDAIYTSAGDPLWGETEGGLDTEKFTGGPTDYEITKTNPMNDYLGWGGEWAETQRYDLCGRHSLSGLPGYAGYAPRAVQPALAARQ